MTTVRRPVKRGNPDPAEASLERTLDGSFAWTCPPAHQAFPDITSKTYGACFLLPFSYSFVNLFYVVVGSFKNADVVEDWIKKIYMYHSSWLVVLVLFFLRCSRSSFVLLFFSSSY